MKLQTYGKSNLLNRGILSKVSRYISRKAAMINNQYVKTLSTKKLVIVLVVNAILASPLIPGGVLICPIFTNLMMR